MTPRQEQILRYIAAHIDKYGYQPSIREIGDRFGIRSPNGVCQHIRRLEKKGIIRAADKCSRSLEFDWKSFL
jgi:repressor LexA